MSDDLHQSVGRIEGKLDALISASHTYQLAHDTRHAVIDQHIDDLKKDINMAKGAKGAILAMVATVSAVISAGIAGAVKWLK